jgi:hypothetical protein
MPRIAPSAKIREEITRLLHDGVPEDQDVVGTLLRLGAGRLAQELLEEEATDFLGRDRYRHRGPEPHRGPPKRSRSLKYRSVSMPSLAAIRWSNVRDHCPNWREATRTRPWVSRWGQMRCPVRRCLHGSRSPP